jgi:hypothetical protein
LLIKAIEDYRLYEFDTALGDSQIATEIAGKPLKTGNKPEEKSPDLEDFTTGMGGKHEVKLRNKVKYVIIRPGDSYEKLIREFSLLPWEIFQYNDLPRTAVAREGEIIYLQPKRRKAESVSHVVTQGETFRDISQQHAIKISRIKKLNKLEETSVLKPGQILRLR